MKLTINYSPKQILVFLWIIFSIGYIAFDLYRGAVVGMYNKGYLTGQTEAFAALVQKVKNEKCEIVTINNPEGAVEVINVACLQQQTQTPPPQINQELGTNPEEGAME